MTDSEVIAVMANLVPLLDTTNGPMMNQAVARFSSGMLEAAHNIVRDIRTNQWLSRTTEPPGLYTVDVELYQRRLTAFGGIGRPILFQPSDGRLLLG